jgi:hypothetical protein
MSHEIRYADSGVAPEDGESAVREWRPRGAARRLELSHEWPRGVGNTGVGNTGAVGTRPQAADPFAGYENYAGRGSW